MVKKTDLINQLFDPNNRQRCLIMFSGGKDSTFLAHMFSNDFNNSVTAFTCDNGFEEETIWRDTETKAIKIGIERQKCTDYNSIFALIFQTLIMEKHVFSAYRDNSNLICLFCSHLFWLLGQRFASEHKIPFVIHGMDPGQIRLLLGPSVKINKENLVNNLIITRMMKKTLIDLLSTFKKTEAYQEERVRIMIDSLLPIPEDIITVYPFSFLEYDPKGMMRFIKDKYGWEPPNRRAMKYYAGSSCRLEGVFKELEKLDFLVDLEATNVRNMKTKYRMNKWDLFVRDLREYMKPKFVDLRNPLYDELGIKSVLVEECKQKKLRFLD